MGMELEWPHLSLGSVSHMFVFVWCKAQEIHLVVLGKVYAKALQHRQQLDGLGPKSTRARASCQTMV